MYEAQCTSHRLESSRSAKTRRLFRQTVSLSRLAATSAPAAEASWMGYGEETVVQPLKHLQLFTGRSMSFVGTHMQRWGSAFKGSPYFRTSRRFHGTLIRASWNFHKIVNVRSTTNIRLFPNMMVGPRLEHRRVTMRTPAADGISCLEMRSSCHMGRSSPGAAGCVTLYATATTLTSWLLAE